MRPFKSQHVIDGCVSPNTILETTSGFYISYNDRDTKIYGDVTTAIVIGECSKFYILKGDHRKELADLSKQGLDACLAYYQANKSLQHPSSDKLD